MRAYFAAILFVLTMIIMPWLVQAGSTMNEVGNILTPTTTTTEVRVELIPPITLTR